MKPLGTSCDTFVALADVTRNGKVIFGKNSDRPAGEVQEVVNVARKNYEEGSILKCTYIDIPQVRQTHAVILSKPAWMWGAEMGVNEMGVAIGNEAVWNRLSHAQTDLVPRLLGMDLLRLALERSSSAEDGVTVITDLLAKFGQGGPCSDRLVEFYYHNSFLIADNHEAWVLETAGHFWVAERVTTGVRNISNCMSVRTKIDKIHPDLKHEAQNQGWWNGKDDFDWKQIIGNLSDTELVNPEPRYLRGKQLLEELSVQKSFSVQDMAAVLRDTECRICRDHTDDFPTVGSQISELGHFSDGVRSRDWFTASPDTNKSVFKLTPNFSVLSKTNNLSELTKSPISFPTKPKVPSDLEHQLWSIHQTAKWQEMYRSDPKFEALSRLEAEQLKDRGTKTSEAEDASCFDSATKHEIKLIGDVISGQD